MNVSAPSISEYGVIGDMRTAALVSRQGGIDWCCLPRFDSGSVFAALLDPQRGGTWQIQPAEPFQSTQRYLTGTNVLQTTFATPEGEVVLTDFMPVAEGRPPPPILRFTAASMGFVARSRCACGSCPDSSTPPGPPAWKRSALVSSPVIAPTRW